MINNLPTFSSDEFMELSRELEKHHAVFYKLWNMGRPQFTDKVKTGAVLFDKSGDCIDFMINYDFWSKLSSAEKQFVICHECSHVILNHGVRIKNASDPMITNQALDIVVNHGLIERFGFNRAEVDPTNKYCWVDTVFNDKTIPTDKAFEYYYNLLAQKGGQGQSTTSSITVDDHSGLDDFGDVIKRLNEELSAMEKESLKNMIEKHFQSDDDNGQQAGTGSGNSWVFANVGIVKKKKKWETVIKNWALKYIKDASEEQWARTSRRMLFFGEDLIIPTEAEIEASEKDKIQVYFFQDTSGSCSGFVDRFFKAAASLPTDRFDVKMHCFDTRVFETTLESKKLYGFGGTSFHCIESYIQAYIAKHKLPYPKAVFVITDGFGDYVHPKKPEVWNWFLSHPYTSYIPKESKIYMLKDFE